jgi:UDP-GlcNAc3NAcA epimerase
MNAAQPPLWLFVVGARPQFVKLAAVLRAAGALAARLEAAGQTPPRLQTLHTGQHYDHGMSQVFFDEMEIPTPDLNLGVGSGPHGAMTGKMLRGLEREFIERRPAVVVTFGDTNSTMAAALAAAKLRIPTAHVEAGLRSFNRAMPEEINRVVTDHVSDWLFCPSAAARDQLAREGLTRGVHVVGDVMFDALLHYRRRAAPPPFERPFALATLHRQETVDDPEILAPVMAALAASPIPVVLPAHPRTRKRLIEFDIPLADSVRLVEPLSYFEMLGCLDACDFVLTDSGGLQKEAFYCGKRCLTLRSETEWTELVDIGANRVVGADEAAIRDAFAWARQPLDAPASPYGDGHAAELIVDILHREQPPPATTQ